MPLIEKAAVAVVTALFTVVVGGMLVLFAVGPQRVTQRRSPQVAQRQEQPRQARVTTILPCGHPLESISAGIYLCAVGHQYRQRGYPPTYEPYTLPRGAGGYYGLR